MARYPFKAGESYSRDYVVDVVEEHIRRGTYKNVRAAWAWLEHIRKSPCETIVWTPFAGFGLSPMNPNAWRTPEGEPIWKPERVPGG